MKFENEMCVWSGVPLAAVKEKQRGKFDMYFGSCKSTCVIFKLKTNRVGCFSRLPCEVCKGLGVCLCWID